MPQPTRVPLPEDDYLARIGQLVYMVGYLEWGVLGDLTALGNPGGLTVEGLAGKETGTIARALSTAAAGMVDPDIQQLIATAGDALADISGRRNGVMHARPAAGPSGEPTLFRWRAGGAPESYLLDRSLVDQLIADVDAWNVKVSGLRPAAHAAAGSPL